MKHLTYLTLFASIFGMYSCSPRYNYQVFTNRTAESGTSLKFENQDLKIEYDLWGQNGQLGLSIFNKTDAPLFVDLTQCAISINGVSVPVYTQTTFTGSILSVDSRTSAYYNALGYFVQPSRTKGYSVTRTFNSSPTIFIPNQSTSKQVFLDGQIGSRYKDAPTRLTMKEPKRTYTFKKENTPLSYRFTLGYSTTKDFTAMKFMNNEFWVESITLIKEKDFLGNLIKQPSSSRCNGSTQRYSLPYFSENNFFVKYPVCY